MDEDLLQGGADVENDSDADLDALLEDANRLIGRPPTSRKRVKTGDCVAIMITFRFSLCGNL